MLQTATEIVFKNRTYKNKLLIYFLFSLIVFSVIFTIFLYESENKLETDTFDVQLSTYANQVYSFLYFENVFDDNKKYKLRAFINSYFDHELRVTITDRKGSILFDNGFDKAYGIDISDTKEISQALSGGIGREIRKDLTNGESSYFYAINYGDYIIRTSLPNNDDIKEFISTNTAYLYLLFFVFISAFFILLYLTDQIGRSIGNLKEFAQKAANDMTVNMDIKFGRSELGEVSKNIMEIYSKLKSTKDELSLERNKLRQHLQISNNGIAVFSKEKELITHNKKFVEYVTLIAGKEVSNNLEQIFEMSEFVLSDSFFDTNLSPEERNRFKIVELADKTFEIKFIAFDDQSFEIVIYDITEKEHHDKVKTQLTSNISHELKTPTAVILGYMETILDNPKLSDDKILQFVEKSFKQAQRLQSLINDISTLNKIDEASELFKLTEINICSVIKGIVFDCEFKFSERHIKFSNKINSDISVKGNRFLIDSIFRNMIENSINYAGKFIDIEITNHFTDKDYYYFTYKDTGKGVDKEHLSRLFERFYRVEEGRSRKSTAGTGLGLSIVKHAVEFHKGSIYAKSEPENGIEFTFSLKRDL